MNAKNQPSQADVVALLAKVAEQDLRVRELQAELEQFAQVIEEFQNSAAVKHAIIAPVPARTVAAIEASDRHYHDAHSDVEPKPHLLSEDAARILP